jgi:hypothetical protein
MYSGKIAVPPGGGGIVLSIGSLSTVEEKAKLLNSKFENHFDIFCSRHYRLYEYTGCYGSPRNKFHHQYIEQK